MARIRHKSAGEMGENHRFGASRQKGAVHRPEWFTWLYPAPNVTSIQRKRNLDVRATSDHVCV